MKIKSPNVFILEFKNDSWISKIIKVVTGHPYSHTGMYISDTFYELDGMGVNYKKSKKKLATIQKNPLVDVFAVDKKFTKKQLEKMHLWWKKKIDLKKEYGYEKLISMIFFIPLKPFFKWYYRKTRKPFKISFLKKSDVCSIAVDKCLKEGGYDIFPEYGESYSAYPGLFAQLLKNNLIKFKENEL